jgi:hypothetical protein
VSLKELQEKLPMLRIKFTNGLTLTMNAIGSYLMPCSGAFTSFTSGIGSFDGGMIGGWSFMNQFVTVFDIDHMQLGFAPSVSCPIPNRATASVTMSEPASYYRKPAPAPVRSAPTPGVIETGWSSTSDARPSVSATGGSGVNAFPTGPVTGMPIHVDGSSIPGAEPIIPVVSATGTAQAASSIFASTGSVTPVGDQSQIAVVTLLTSHSYALFQRDPARFERSLLQDLKNALDVSLSRISNLIEKETLHASGASSQSTVEAHFLILPPKSDSTLSLDAVVASLQQHVADANSTLRRGDVTRFVTAATITSRSACADSSFADPCATELSTDSPSFDSLQWYIILAVIVGALLILLGITYTVYRWCRTAHLTRKEEAGAHSRHTGARSTMRRWHNNDNSNAHQSSRGCARSRSRIGTEAKTLWTRLEHTSQRFKRSTPDGARKLYGE